MQVKSVGADGSNSLSSLCRLRLVDLERLYGTTLSDVGWSVCPSVCSHTFLCTLPQSNCVFL